MAQAWSFRASTSDQKTTVRHKSLSEYVGNTHIGIDYRYLTKLSISLPFNFEHVTHKNREQLPPLETVHEKGLADEFWSLTAYERPKRRLNGIQADDLTEKLRAMGVEKGASSSRPTSPEPVELPTNVPRSSSSVGRTSMIDGMMLDEARATISNSTGAWPMHHYTKQPVEHSRRRSSLVAHNEQRLKFLRQDLPRRAVDTSEAQHTQQAGHETGQKGAALRAVPEERDLRSTYDTLQEIDRTKQPLPPLPPQGKTRHASKTALPTTSDSAIASVTSTVSSNRLSNDKSKRSSCPARKSPALSSYSTSADARPSTIIPDATWEDDVDFCYQQEAESTCNFDWQGTSVLREPSFAESDSGNRFSTWMPFSSASDSQSPSAQKPTTSNISEHQSPSESLRRGSSVGHRGFLSARKSVSDIAQKRHAPPSTIELPWSTQGPSILSPVPSVADLDQGSLKSPSSFGTLHFHGFDSVNAEYLSDPESIRTGGSKHAKSSSFGSYESIARWTPVDGERARWSVASSNHVPELMHSKRHSKSSLRKSLISKPLESLPQSPGAEDAKEGEVKNTIVPRASQTQPMRNTFVMRRPRTTSDRAVLQAAGRAVQLNRPPTPSRFSRLLQAKGKHQLAVTAPGPGWI